MVLTSLQGNVSKALLVGILGLLPVQYAFAVTTVDSTKVAAHPFKLNQTYSTTYVAKLYFNISVQSNYYSGPQTIDSSPPACLSGYTQYPLAVPITSYKASDGIEGWYGTAWMSGNTLLASFNANAGSGHSDQGGRMNIIFYCVSNSATQPMNTPWSTSSGQENG